MTMKMIDNIDQVIATRELCKQIIVDNGLNMDVFDMVYPNKNLPEEFLVAKSIVQSNDGRPISSGAVEICIYVANDNRANDKSQPNLSRISELTGIFIAGIKNASKNKIAFNDYRTMLVRDDDVRCFYQSIVINTVSINV